MQVTAQNRVIIPLRWKLDPEGIVVLYLFTNILFFARCETADHMNESTHLPSTCPHVVQFWTPSPVTQRRGERVPLFPALRDRRGGPELD